MVVLIRPAQCDLESVSRDEDEQYDQANADEDRKKQDHHCTFVHEFSDVGFPDA